MVLIFVLPKSELSQDEKKRGNFQKYCKINHLPSQGKTIMVKANNRAQKHKRKSWPSKKSHVRNSDVWPG